MPQLFDSSAFSSASSSAQTIPLVDLVFLWDEKVLPGHRIDHIFFFGFAGVCIAVEPGRDQLIPYFLYIIICKRIFKLVAHTGCSTNAQASRIWMESGCGNSRMHADLSFAR